MKKIKLANWRFYLMFFLTLTSGCVTIDCIYKAGMNFHDVMVLILQNSVLPAFIAGVLFLRHSLRNADRES
jgi:hypothetical protein